MIKIIRSGILKYLTDNWSATPIHMPNSKQPVTAPYIRATFLPVDTAQIAIGEPGSAKHDSILALDVFVDVNSGTGVSATHMAALTTLFTRGTRVTKSGITATFKEPIPLAGRDDGHGYFMETLQCPWFAYYDN